MVAQKKRRLTNGIRFAAYSAARGSLRLGHIVPTPSLTHIWAGSVSPPKCRIPRTLYDIKPGSNFCKRLFCDI